jgi:hypothetical protein
LQTPPYENHPSDTHFIHIIKERAIISKETGDMSLHRRISYDIIRQ